jgi:hypothetical protein
MSFIKATGRTDQERAKSALQQFYASKVPSGVFVQFSKKVVDPQGNKGFLFKIMGPQNKIFYHPVIIKNGVYTVSSQVFQTPNGDVQPTAVSGMTRAPRRRDPVIRKTHLAPRDLSSISFDETEEENADRRGG